MLDSGRCIQMLYTGTAKHFVKGCPLLKSQNGAFEISKQRF